MAIRKVKYNDTYIYVEDEVDEKETGIICKDLDLNETKEIKIDKKDNLEDTLTDIFGDDNE